MTEKLNSIIKTKGDYDNMMDIFFQAVIDNMPISSHPMKDGLAIAFLHSKSGVFIPCFINDKKFAVLDGTMQMIEFVLYWLSSNEDKLCEMLSNQKE